MEKKILLVRLDYHPGGKKFLAVLFRQHFLRRQRKQSVRLEILMIWNTIQKNSILHQVSLTDLGSI